MALFGRDYDRDYGYYGGNRNEQRGYRGNMYGGGNNYGGGSYGGNMYGGGNYGGGNMYGSYDRDMGYSGGAGGYDRENYKSRWQTDYGDPFGDRTSHTPMRVIRGEYRGYDRDMRGGGMGYDREWRGGGQGGYGRDYYAANPVGYDPYMGRPNEGMGRPNEGRMGSWNRYDNGYRSWGNDRGYDRGWF